jgi:hypothetical protein
MQATIRHSLIPLRFSFVAPRAARPMHNAASSRGGAIHGLHPPNFHHAVLVATDTAVKYNFNP